VETLWLVNGRRGGVDPADRGLAYGDGLFETMAAHDGAIRWLDHHMERLLAGCVRLGIGGVDEAALRSEIAAHCPPRGRAVVKLIVTRGVGTRGYRPPERCEPTRILSISSWPAYPSGHYTNGIRVHTCELRLGENPHLAGMKHLNRLEQVLAQMEITRGQADEGLLLDAHDRVVGGGSSNVFGVWQEELLTPSLERCGVRGVMRRVVLDAAAKLGLRVAERDLPRPRFDRADEIFVTNALFGIWPVTEIDGRALPVGPLTRRLMSAVEVGGG
jgi:4-amino-4-deoxychorismate lyase